MDVKPPLLPVHIQTLTLILPAVTPIFLHIFRGLHHKVHKETRLTEVDGESFLKELHSITYDLPSRDLRLLLNKLMVKLSVWDTDLMVSLLRSYDAVYPLTEKQYEILWIDLAFPHLFCAIAHKYYLKQKKSWSDEKYNWILQNMMSVEHSKEDFLQQLPALFKDIKSQQGVS